MRDGEYCISHIDVMLKEKCISERRYNELKDWGDFREINPAIAELSEGATMVLMRETESEIQAKAIESIRKQIEHGDIATAKQVKTLLDNIRNRQSNRGGDHKGAANSGGRIQSGQDSAPEQPTLTMEDFLSAEKNEVGDSEDLERDTLQGDFSGNIESTPDEQEKPDGSDVQKQPVTTRDPEVIKTVIADRLEEKRIAQEIRDLRENKESEKHTQKDEMERDALAEDAESIRIYFDLVKTLTACFKEAIRNGLRSERVEEAISDALNIAFEARPDTPENLGITEYTKAEKDIQKLKALTKKKEKWVREDAKKEEEQ